jgi:hypothetical protein
MFKWCRTCQLNYLRKFFICGDEKIDELVKEMQLRINNPKDIVFELIPHNHFDNIERDYSTGISAVWKDGPLVYDTDTRRYNRRPNGKFTLKLLDGSIDEFTNKV